jgi:hypothetical protein
MVFRPSHASSRSTSRRSFILACRLAVGLCVIAGPAIGYAHESVAAPTREEPTTRFEAFVARCAPCVRESYAVATLPLPALRLSGFGPSVASIMARGGEVRLEVVRAYPLGKVNQQTLVMRATLLTKTGDGQPYPVATGLLDADAVPALATAVADMARMASSRPAQDSAADMTEIEFGGGSVRVGTIRIQGAEVAYIQAADVRAVRAPSAFETTHAMFLPISDLPAFQSAIGEVARRIHSLRGR